MARRIVCRGGLVVLAAILAGCASRRDAVNSMRPQLEPPYNAIVCGKAPEGGRGDLAELNKGELAALARNAAGKPVWTSSRNPLRIKMIGPQESEAIGLRQGGGSFALSSYTEQVQDSTGASALSTARASGSVKLTSDSGGLALAQDSGAVSSRSQQLGMSLEEAGGRVGVQRGGAGLQSQAAQDIVHDREDIAHLRSEKGGAGIQSGRGIGQMRPEEGAGQLTAGSGGKGELAVAEGVQQARGKMSGEGELNPAAGGERIAYRAGGSTLETASGMEQKISGKGGSGTLRSAGETGHLQRARGSGSLSGRYRSGHLESYDREGMLSALERQGISTGYLRSGELRGSWREGLMGMADSAAVLAVRPLVPASGILMHGQYVAVAVLYRNTSRKPLHDGDIVLATPDHAQFDSFVEGAGAKDYQAEYESEEDQLKWTLEKPLQAGETFVGVVAFRSDPWNLYMPGNQGNSSSRTAGSAHRPHNR